MHLNVVGVLPDGRAQMDGCVMEQFGAAIMVGGKFKDGQTLCDMWVLDLDAVIYFVENPDT